VVLLLQRINAMDVPKVEEGDVLINNHVKVPQIDHPADDFDNDYKDDLLSACLFVIDPMYMELPCDVSTVVLLGLIWLCHFDKSSNDRVGFLPGQWKKLVKTGKTWQCSYIVCFLCSIVVFMKYGNYYGF